MKKISVLIALVLALMLCASCALADSVLGADIDVAGKLVILHTNDVHGRAVQTDDVLGYATVAALRNTLVEEGAVVILLDAGDASQGMPIVNMSTGLQAIDFMNAVGYDAMVLGNHEFDWGSENTMVLVEHAEFPVLGANIISRATGEPLLNECIFFELEDGTRIGVVGLDTPEVATKTHPDKIRDIQVLMAEDMYACTQAQVDWLREQGCDMVILLCHLGVDDESAPNRSIDVVENVTGIDLCIDAHSHTVIEGGQVYGSTLITSTGCYLSNIGYVIVDENGMTAGLYNGENPVTDEDIAAFVNTVNDEVNAALGVPFAQTEVLLNGDRAPGVRTMETNLGDFCADALLWQASQYVGDDVVAAVTNGGGIRASIQVGDISMLDMKTVFPFGNTVVTIDVTGAELLEALEASTCSTPDAIGAFPQVAGMEIVIDTTVPFNAGELYPDSTYHQPVNPGERVTILTIGGEAFDPERIYRIATNDFMAAGGDTYYVFSYAGNTAKIDTGIALEDALVNYTAEVLNGVVTAEAYGDAMGRITIK